MASIGLVRQEFFIPQVGNAPSAPECNKIISVASRAFLEIGVALALNISIMTFIATPLTLTMMSGLILGTLAIGAVRIAFDFYRDQNWKATIEKENAKVKGISHASLVNTIGLAGPNIVIHEAGHAFASIALLKEAQPEISIFPYRGGSTSYVISNGATKVGEFLGKRNSLLIITAAGMMASTFFALFEFGLASKLEESYPTISKIMTDHAIFQLLNEIVYAITAFVTSKADLAHDFVCLWQAGGIHPAIPIAFMIALPLIELAILRMLKWRKNAERIRNEVCKVVEMPLPVKTQHLVAN